MNPLPLFVSAGLIVAGAAVHGAATHRWQALVAPDARTEALHWHTVELGDYQSEVIPTEFEVKEKSRVTCRRYLSRSAELGAVVSVTTGPPGAVATHAPDVCYPASGYATLSPPRKETVELPDGSQATYYVAEYEKKSATRSDRQKVRWAWAAPGGSWEAPDSPRFNWAYMSRPELYKLYVVTAIPTDARDFPTEDVPAARQFVTAAFAQYSGLLTGR